MVGVGIQALELDEAMYAEVLYVRELGVQSSAPGKRAAAELGGGLVCVAPFELGQEPGPGMWYQFEGESSIHDGTAGHAVQQGSLENYFGQLLAVGALAAVEKYDAAALKGAGLGAIELAETVEE